MAKKIGLPFVHLQVWLTTVIDKTGNFPRKSEINYFIVAYLAQIEVGFPIHPCIL